MKNPEALLNFNVKVDSIQDSIFMLGEELKYRSKKLMYLNKDSCDNLSGQISCIKQTLLDRINAIKSSIEVL